jgi:hypothetical protein
MSNQGVHTRGKSKFGSVSAAVVIDDVVTNSVKSAVEDAISESVAPDFNKEKAKAGKKKKAKVGIVTHKATDVADLHTSTTIDIFDFVDDAIDTTCQLTGQKKKAKVGSV